MWRKAVFSTPVSATEPDTLEKGAKYTGPLQSCRFLCLPLHPSLLSGFVTVSLVETHSQHRTRRDLTEGDVAILPSASCGSGLFTTVAWGVG